MWTILSAVVGTLLRVLFGRLLTPKDPEKEILHADLDAKREESQALAAPDRGKPPVVDFMRDHEVG